MRRLFQKVKTRNTFIRIIRRRKMAPDIPKSRSAQKGVNNRMNKNIRIRVAGQTFLIWYPDASQDEGATPAKTMSIKTLSYTIKRLYIPSFRLRKMQEATLKSSARVILILYGDPKTKRTGCPKFSTAEASSVIRIPSCCTF